MRPDIELFSTLLPSMGHFSRFANDPRMTGIRLNTPMLSEDALQKEFDLLSAQSVTSQMFFDVKGRQLRVLQSQAEEDHLELVINHPVSAAHNSLVLFKAGADCALLDQIVDDGLRLIFQGGPQYMVKPGESFHVIDDSFVQSNSKMLNEWEVKRIEAALAAGFSRFLLSYTESMSDVVQLQELIGDRAEIWLKIESQAGLRFVEQEFVKRNNLTLVAARGDLYVELKRKHDILQALQLIIGKDPMAIAGSRILLSVVNEPVPSCADLSELAWLREIGYSRFMLCDELCLVEDMLATAVNVFEAVMNSYEPSSVVSPTETPRLWRRTRRVGKR